MFHPLYEKISFVEEEFIQINRSTYIPRYNIHNIYIYNI